LVALIKSNNLCTRDAFPPMFKKPTRRLNWRNLKSLSNWFNHYWWIIKKIKILEKRKEKVAESKINWTSYYDSTNLTWFNQVETYKIQPKSNHQQVNQPIPDCIDRFNPIFKNIISTSYLAKGVGLLRRIEK